MQLLIYVEAITKYDIYLSFQLIYSKFQMWRLFTNLFYFGDISIISLFSITMLYRCSRRLEEHTFRNNAADYLFFLLIGVTVMSTVSYLIELTVLSKSFLTMLLYLWSRYNRNMVLLLFGFIPMKAPYITWFFVLLDVIMGEPIAYDILGIAIGHLFYFFNDIYPKLPQSQGKKIFKAPKLFTKMIEAIIPSNHNAT